MLLAIDFLPLISYTLLMSDKERIEQSKKSVKARAERMAEQSIGKPFAVRIGRNEINRGTITRIETLEPVFNGRSVCARWRVHFAMGGLNHPPVIVASLPR